MLTLKALKIELEMAKKALREVLLVGGDSSRLVELGSLVMHLQAEYIDALEREVESYIPEEEAA